MALRRKSISEDSVFLNIPYDEKFKKLYLAYIAGLVNFGLIPVVTLGLPGGKRRLEKIFALIQDCRYSVHDISRVTLDDGSPPTPRFNMPFELGLAVAWEASGASSLYEAEVFRELCYQAKIAVEVRSA